MTVEYWSDNNRLPGSDAVWEAATRRARDAGTGIPGLLRAAATEIGRGGSLPVKLAEFVGGGLERLGQLQPRGIARHFVGELPDGPRPKELSQAVRRLREQVAEFSVADPHKDWSQLLEDVHADSHSFHALLQKIGVAIRSRQPLHPSVASFAASGLRSLANARPQGFATWFECKQEKGRSRGISTKLKRALCVELLMRRAGVSKSRAADLLAEHKLVDQGIEESPSTWVRDYNERSIDAVSFVEQTEEWFVAACEDEGISPPVDLVTPLEPLIARCLELLGNNC